MSNLPQLETKHWAWIWEVAAEHFAKEIAEKEMAIVRHQHFAEPIAVPHVARNTMRGDEIARLKDSIRQYRDILTVLLALREGVSEMSAIECAEQFKKMINQRDSTPI